jgi:hypothetical protein
MRDLELLQLAHDLSQLSPAGSASTPTHLTIAGGNSVNGLSYADFLEVKQSLSRIRPDISLSYDPSIALNQ